MSVFFIQPDTEPASELRLSTEDVPKFIKLRSEMKLDGSYHCRGVMLHDNVAAGLMHHRENDIPRATGNRGVTA